MVALLLGGQLLWCLIQTRRQTEISRVEAKWGHQSQRKVELYRILKIRNREARLPSGKVYIMSHKTINKTGLFQVFLPKCPECFAFNCWNPDSRIRSSSKGKGLHEKRPSFMVLGLKGERTNGGNEGERRSERTGKGRRGFHKSWIGSEFSGSESHNL